MVRGFYVAYEEMSPSPDNRSAFWLLVASYLGSSKLQYLLVLIRMMRISRQRQSGFSGK
jgi:hypothetical protein